MKQKKLLKRALSWLLATAMAIGTITIFGPEGANVASAAEENLITNGGFDTAFGWVHQDGTAVPAQNKVDDVTVTDVVKHGTFENITATEEQYWSWGTAGKVVEGEGVDGSTAMAQEGKGSMYFCMAGSERFLAGVTYKVTFQGKVDASTTSWVCYLGQLGDVTFTPSGSIYSVISGKGNTTYQTYTFSFTPGTDGSGQVGFQVTSNTGTFYIDNLTITYETVEPLFVQTDVLGHGTFENMTEAQLGYWTNETIAEGEGVDGSTAMKRSGAGAIFYVAPSTNKFQANTTYTVKFQAKATTGTTWICYVDGTDVTYTISTGNSKWNILGNKNGNDEWAWYEYQFSADIDTRGQIGFQITSTAGTLYIDNVTIFHETRGVDETDVVENGDFEDTSIKKWLKGTITTGAGYNGTAGLVYTPASEGGETYCELSGLDTTGTLTYKMKIRVKTDGATGRLYSLHDGSWRLLASIAANTAWTEYTTTFTTTSGQYRIGIESGATSGTIHIDDLRITYETPAMKKTYTQGIGTCLDAEADNVLSMKSFTEVKQAINMTSGVDYVYAFKVKSVDEGSNLTFGVQAGSTRQAVSVTPDWTEVTGTINLSSDATEFGFYRFGEGEVLIDDVTLIRKQSIPDLPSENTAVNYCDLGSNKEGYLVSTSDTTATITDSEGNDRTVEAGKYTTLDTPGEYTITREQEETDVVLYKRGDANGDFDGVITAKDLVAVKKRIADGMIESASAKASDVNVDGVLDSSDAKFMRETLVKDYDLITTQKGLSSLGQGVMPIIGLNGPTKAEDFTALAELGINYVVINTADVSNNTILAEEILNVAEKSGIKVYLNNDNATSPDSDEQIVDVAALSAFNSNYDGYTSFAGYYVSDDVYYKKRATSASGTYFANNGIAGYKKVLGSVANYLNVNTYLNLLPINSPELGYSISGEETSTGITYEQYRAYAKAASDAGSDFLPYSMHLKEDSVYTHLTEAFYTNLDWMRSICLEEDINKPFYATVQTGVDFHDGNLADIEESKLLTAAEMYLEANAALAMGAKGIQYNAVMQQREWAKNHGNTLDPYDYARSGLLNAKGERNTIYYDAAQKINRYIAFVDHILMDATSKGVITTNEEIAEYISGAKIEKFGALKSVSDTNNHALVGCFEYFGKDTFLVTNTSVTDVTTVTLNFDGAVNGIVKTFDCTSDEFREQSKYVVTLEAGESVLLVLGYESGDQGANVEKAPVEESVSLEDQTNLADTIEVANSIANDVQAYYTDGTKANYTIENQNMVFTHGTKNMRSIKNKNGVAYPTEGNSFDVIVMYDGVAHYSNKSTTNTWVNTTKLGYYYYETNLYDLDFGTAVPNIHLQKTYHTYPDKMHQSFRVISNGADTDKITQIGFRTTFRANNITEISLFDGEEELKTVTPDTTASSLEYAGFYIEGVGVIGFIAAGQNTNLQVSTDGTIIYVSQYVNNIDFSSGEVTFGNRVYTDNTQSFDGLKQANEEEQNPLKSEISVNTTVDGASYEGYNHLTGAYTFHVDGCSLGAAFKDGQKKFYENITVQNVKEPRMIYLDVHTDEDLEAAVLVQSNKQIPIPLQVSKNFAGENEKEIYNPDTKTYGETYLPLCVKPNEIYEFSVIHLYENWGSQGIRLKQLSSIEYYNSYYHLSTGVRETNCIAPYYASKGYEEYYQDTAWFLPDFRGASTDPQPTSEMIQKSSVGVLRGPSNGDYLATYESSDIHSAGLTYADLDYSYESDDGKYRYTIRQVEMPQEDEARTYCTIEFKILKDCTLTQNNFEIIGFNGARCRYNKAAYLNTNGVHKELDTSFISGWYQSGIYNLNRNGAYFTLYDLVVFDANDTTLEAGNLGVIVKESDVALAFRHESIKPKYWNTQMQNYAALTLAADTKFTAEETFKVDLVLLPFGSKEQDDCQNVLDVYQDSVVNPLTINVKTGTVVDDSFVPTVKAVDNVAEFTLTGGVAAKNTSGVNYAVKVTDFDILGNPLIQEYVDGQWVAYNYSTELGYDGYSVEYEDNSLAYSFVFTQTDATEGRTFRVIKPKDANVNYYVNGKSVKSVNVKAGQTVERPTDAELGVIGHKILGFYSDAAGIHEYAFGQYLTEDINIYVEVSDVLHFTAEQLGTFKATFADSKKVEDGVLALGTEQTRVNMYLYRKDLNINLGGAELLTLEIPSSTNVRSLHVKLLGTYLDAEGNKKTAEVTSQVENQGDWNNWNTTSYIIYPNTSGTYTIDLTNVFSCDGSDTVSKYIAITGIMIFTDPVNNMSAQEVNIAFIQGERPDTHTVNYMAKGTVVKTETVGVGQKPTIPIDMDACVMGYEVQGYYRDAEYTIKYDFGNWITSDTTIYVKTSDTFYMSSSAVCTFSKSGDVSSVTMQEDGAAQIMGAGDVYVFKNGLSGINVENQMLELKVKKTNNVGVISMYLHGTYTKNGVSGTITDYSGDYWAAFTDTGQVDSEGYSIYTLDFANIKGVSWKTLTGFRIGANSPTELALDIQYVKASGN